MRLWGKGSLGTFGQKIHTEQGNKQQFNLIEFISIFKSYLKHTHTN